MSQDYPLPGKNSKYLDINNLDDNYVGKILSCDTYKTELDQYINISKYDKEGKYTPKLIFAGYMNRKKLFKIINNNYRKYDIPDNLLDIYIYVYKKKNYLNVDMKIMVILLILTLVNHLINI